VEELEPARSRKELEQARGALIGIVVRALEERRVAVEEVELPVDHAVTTRQ
jgi:hypothetical protein